MFTENLIVDIFLLFAVGAVFLILILTGKAEKSEPKAPHGLSEAATQSPLKAQKTAREAPTSRRSNVNARGGGFSETEIESVWQKGAIHSGSEDGEVRKDVCGALMKKSDYGNTDSDYGWEVDHIKPVSKGGEDDLENLQPLQWRNNRGKSDAYPKWLCAVESTHPPPL